MKPGRAPFVPFLLTLVLTATGQAQAQTPAPSTDAPRALQDTPASVEAVTASQPEREPIGRRLLNSTAGVTAINATVWAIDRYALDAEWARISPATWGRNLRHGLVWDKDGFGTNQFAHPYHGGIYYNAARNSGFGYAGASLFTFLGSLQWELFGENEYPSINDLFNTSLGGIAFGEALHRLSSHVLDNRATGLGRFGREVLGATLNPSRGLDRLWDGESWRVSATPPGWRAQRIAYTTRTGYLKLAGGGAPASGTDQLFVQASLQYGDPVYGVIEEPFDAYMAVAQFNSNTEYQLISHAEVQAVLASTPLVSTEDTRLVLGLLQHYYYTNIQAYEIGAQSLSGSLLYGRKLSEGTGVRGGLHLKGVVLGSISSEHNQDVGRDYGYGPGLHLALDATYLHGAWGIASAQVDVAWMHTVNGADSTHLINGLRVQVDLPVYGSLGVGVGAVFFRRASSFRDYEDITQYSTQLRGFISVH
jgi:hypothetical protein